MKHEQDWFTASIAGISSPYQPRTIPDGSSKYESPKYESHCTSLALIFGLWNATVSVSPLVTAAWKYARCRKTNDMLVSERCAWSTAGTPRRSPQTCLAARALGHSSDASWCLQELLLGYITATNNYLVLEVPEMERMKRKKCTLRTRTKCHKLMPGLPSHELSGKNSQKCLSFIMGDCRCVVLGHFSY